MLGEFEQYFRFPRSVYLLCLGTFINRAGTFVMVFLSLYLTSQLGCDAKFALRTIGLFGFGTVLAAGVGGHLADLIGRRVVMLAALLGGSAILVVFSFVTTHWLIMLLALVFGFIGEMYRPACSAMMADLTAPAERAKAFSLMFLSINLGFAVGAFVGGTIAGYGFHWLFWGDALTSTIYAVIIAVFIRETLPSRNAVGHTEQTGCDMATSIQSNGQRESSHFSFREAALHILTNYPFLCFCLGNFFIAFVFMQATSAFPLYLEKRGFKPEEYGSIIAINGILIVLFQVPIAAFVSRYHRGLVVVVAAILNAIGFGLFAFMTTKTQFALATAVWTLGEMFFFPYGNAIVSDFSPTRLRGRYMGVFGMSFSFSMVFAAPIGGEILERSNYGRVLWIIMFGFSMVAALLYLSIYKHLAVKKEAAAVVG